MARNNDFASIFEFIASTIMRTDVSADVNHAILREICNSLGYDAAFIYMYNAEMGDDLYLSEKLLLSGHYDFPPCLSRHILEDADCDAKTREDISLALTEPLKEVLFQQSDGASRQFAEVLVQPIIENGRVLGVIGLMSFDPAHDREYSASEACARVLLSILERDYRVGYNKKQKRRFMQSLERAVDSTGIDIYIVDFYTHEILYMNKSMAEPYGAPEELIGQKCYLTLYSDKTEECDFCPKKMLVDEHGNPVKAYSWDYQRPFDGSWFRVSSAAFKWEENRLAHVISSVDITESKNNEMMVVKMALYDALTGIPNRRSFERDFAGIVDSALREDKPGFILFLDLDNFKHINDAFGHEKGDELLKGVAAYLDGFSNERQQVYRYGGDEFIILIEDISIETVSELVSLFLFRFSESWELDDLEYFCTVSIGVASYPDDGVTYDALLNAADDAMYEAKKKGKSTVAYASANKKPKSQAVEREFALRRAILDGCGEFEVLYHPIVEIDTGRWSGVEALARWNSRVYGVLAPHEFIPLCEKLGLISELEKWLLESALRDVSEWGKDVPGDFFLSFNVSAMEFFKDDFNEFLISIADAYGFPHDRLMLEIIESTANFHLKVNEIRPRLDALRDDGFLIALDGFGIGYNSLERIQELNVDFIKIDRKFVTDFMHDELRVAVVRAIIMLARAAKAKVCAEGIESESHIECLKAIDCDYVQGRYFTAPLNASAMIEALSKRGSKE